MTAISALVLAGERAGGGLLARHFGAGAGALVPVAGIACVQRVVDALRLSASIGGGVVCGPDQRVAEHSDVLAGLLARGDFQWMAPRPGPSESAHAALAAMATWPVLVTTADHALLTPRIIDAFCDAAAAQHEDVIVGLAAHAQVKAAFPHSRRTVLAFADGGRCGTNLFYLRNPNALRVIDFWQAMQADRKRPLRMARRLGVSALVRYAAGRLSTEAALAAIGARAGCSIGWVDVADPRAAVDVDSIDDHALAERILTSDATASAA
jgi:GTP:adenosylcobinamide-phosphate guanylyltransferase